MKTENVKIFFRDNYALKDNSIQLKNKEIVNVTIGSISASSKMPVYSYEPPKYVWKKIVNKERYFILLGETETETTRYIRNALNENGMATDDYIVAIEPLQITGDKKQVYRGMDFDYILEQAKKYPKIGIYRKRVEGDADNSYNLVFVRVIENGVTTTQYMDAYFASSDSCTYHDVKYTVAQFEQPNSVRCSSQQDSKCWPHNLLIFGAPGTGKSHSIQQKIEELGWSANTQRVTFYEDYIYEKFVGAYLPSAGKKINDFHGNLGSDEVNLRAEGNAIEYRFVPGVFLQMIADAWFDSNSRNAKPHVLVIEEINRANAASVFGEFFQLLDRDGNGISEYSISISGEMRGWLTTYLKAKITQLDCEEEDRRNFESWLETWLNDFRLPSNLYLWATMNSADQGVYPLDAAFKRRWSYLYKTTQETRNDDHRMVYIRWKKAGDIDAKGYFVEWDVIKYAINAKMEMAGNVEEDRFVGPWFFKGTEIEQIYEFTAAVSKDRGQMSDPLTNKLFQYLRQDVFRNNPGQLFKDGYLSMSSMRFAMINGVGINEILNLDGMKVNGQEIDEIIRYVDLDVSERKLSYSEAVKKLESFVGKENSITDDQVEGTTE